MRKATNDRRQDHRQNPYRRRCQPCPGCGISVNLLQQLRQQNYRAEVEHISQTDRQAANGEVARLKQRQIDDRVIVCQLPHQQDGQRNYGHDPQHDNLGRVKPVELLSAVQHYLQTADPHYQQHQPDHINPPDFGFGFPATQGLQRQYHHCHTNRHVDKEDPAPVIVIANPATQYRATDRGHDHRHRPQRQRNAALGWGIVVEQQTLRQRNQRTRDDPLNDAEEDQHLQAI